MGEIIEEVGGDGFLITMHNQSVSRKQVIEVTDGLIPALQRRDLMRTEYKYPTLRENLRDFRDSVMSQELPPDGGDWPTPITLYTLMNFWHLSLWIRIVPLA